MGGSRLLAQAWLSLMSLIIFAASASSDALSAISIVGSKFYDGSGNQFFVKGVAYQLTIDDPLSDPTQCALDAAMMKTLGVNTIRVYHVDSSADHSACMTEFANAGIYLLVDLDTFDTAIDPKGAVWTTSQYQAFAKVFDAFANFTNTLGVFVGNEVIALANQSNAAPYIKAAARDMKAYRDSKGYREIPVGYSAADIAELRPMLQNYLACGDNSSEMIDFFSLNAYEWCGDSSFSSSGYDNLNTEAAGYSIPIFFSETGCNTVEPRTFQDQTAILGPDMNNQWSGAVIYEWIEETNDYGLISYGPPQPATATGAGIADGFIRTGTPSAVLPDFTNLQSVWSTLTPTGTPSSAYSPSVTPPACPSSTSGGWLLNGNVPLPTINQALSTSATATSTSTSATSAAATSGTATGSSASASATKGAASGGKEIAGMSTGLVAVMLIFTYWL